MHLKQIILKNKEFPTRNFYPFSLKILQNTQSIELNSSISFFIGENGSGKSTLLRAIADASQIHIWDNQDYYQLNVNDYEKQLHTYLELTWKNTKPAGAFFSSDIFKTFSRNLERWAKNDPGMLQYFGGESLVTKSHGQCNMAFFANRFKLEGLYLLDEPETALSPRKLLELYDLIRNLPSQNRAQFIIATHSPILLAIPEAEIYSFDNEKICKIAYTETEYYSVYKEFLNRIFQV